MLYVMLVGAYPFERPEDKHDNKKLQKMIQVSGICPGHAPAMTSAHLQSTVNTVLSLHREFSTRTALHKLGLLQFCSVQYLVKLLHCCILTLQCYCVKLELIVVLHVLRGCSLCCFLQRILQVEYEFPPHVKVSKECRDLLHKILVPDPAKRITVPDIQNHVWYKKDLPPGVSDMNDNLPPPGAGLQVVFTY